MQLGFVSALLSEYSLEEVLAFAADEGFACIEPMCWPPGKSDRRYAGVSHINVTTLDDQAVGQIKDLVKKYNVALSGLGYYPNPIDPDATNRHTVIDHLKKVITAAPKLGLNIVNTFIGRDPSKTVEENWPLLEVIWRDLLEHARNAGVTVAIENCPMLFSTNEWPGGKNLATTPAVWKKLFDTFPNAPLGLNLDPSHLVWLHVDYVRCIRDFSKRIVHVHAKDTRIDQDRLYAEGIMGFGWHTPKLPGLGDVNWGAFFSALTDAGYHGAICIEVEDRAFEGSLADRKRSLRQSKRYLEQFVS
jgi:sugar phosphate isomerase/epimerase